MLVRLLIGVLTSAALLIVVDRTTHAAATAPIRAFWVSRATLDSPEAIRRALTIAVADGFDTVMVPVVLGDGETPGFDGVRDLVKDARARNLRVHAWIDVNLAAAVGELPASREHVLYQHPEWVMVPREIAPEILRMDVRSPGYIGRLARWVRLNAPRVDGLYISPLDPEAAVYLAAQVSAAVKRYSVDGVFLDALRFPGTDFDYSRHAMEVFRTDRRLTLPVAERARLDEIEAIDPFAYAEEFPDEWRQFREARLTSLMSRLKKALVVVSPTLVVTAGVTADPGSALADSFQDWRKWLGTGLIDGIGRRSGTSGTIVFTADGLSAAIAPLSLTPTPGTAGSR